MGSLGGLPISIHTHFQEKTVQDAVLDLHFLCVTVAPLQDWPKALDFGFPMTSASTPVGDRQGLSFEGYTQKEQVNT